VFSFEDDDGQWLSMRYDLTAPLARFVAEHYDRLPKPFRRYQWGSVFRNEKPGPGRFRQFLQIDADTVGAGGSQADAEMCLMAADCMKTLGLSDNQFSVNINNRKILDAILAQVGLDAQAEDYDMRRLTILRALDKLDRLGIGGVVDLLGDGRKDESGDYTKGAGLDKASISKLTDFVQAGRDTRADTLKALAEIIGDSEIGTAGLEELTLMDALMKDDSDNIRFNPSVVRGLGYYTGPVFEIELNIETEDENGEIARFGSVGGGGRYDDLVKRFKGIEIPATGISIGVSRLAAALTLLGKADTKTTQDLVVLLVMDKTRLAETSELVKTLRNSGIRAEMYMGDSGMKAQMRYADNRNARLVVIEGEDELAAGIVTLKDLQLGQRNAQNIKDNEEWRASEHAQTQVSRKDLAQKIKEILS
jgi:histidyl-tRNA synthetase